MSIIFTPDDIKKMDSAEIKRGRDLFTLVEQAGTQIAYTIKQCHAGKRVLFFCGMGNNGADGIATAHMLEADGYECRVAIMGESANLSASTNMHLEKAKACGVDVRFFTDDKMLRDALDDFYPNIVVDALLGSGATRFPEGLMERVIIRINEYGIMAKVIAVDIPTGILPNTGRVGQNWVSADITVTMQGYKPGLLLYPGADYTGDIRVVHAFDTNFTPDRERKLFGADSIMPLNRNRHTHKGDYGKLAVIAGSRGLSGAGELCAKAALRSGCGMLTIASPESTAHLYAIKLTEAMSIYLDEQDGGYGDCAKDIEQFLLDKDACVIGPGMGKGSGVYDVVAAALSSGKRMVIDADGLNALSANGLGIIKGREDVVLTPHPAELARLMDADIKDVLDDPLKMVERFVEEHGCVCALKMSTTIVAAPGRTAIVTTGSAAMAKGGSGDVLAGCMGGIMASNEDVYYCACMAAYICGKAGELAEKQLGCTYCLPSDEIESLSAVFMEYE